MRKCRELRDKMCGLESQIGELNSAIAKGERELEGMILSELRKCGDVKAGIRNVSVLWGNHYMMLDVLVGLANHGDAQKHLELIRERVKDIMELDDSAINVHVIVSMSKGEK